MTDEAASLRCPACGGTSSPDARACPFCGTHLAAVRCPACAALHFAGALLCSRCGVKLREERVGTGAGRKCPRCTGELVDVRADALSLEECARCGGVFVDHETIGKLTSAPALRGEVRSGSGVVLERTSVEPGLPNVRYVPCPVCAKIMNRKNYAEVSGVIVDVCREHGVWFDAGELTRVVEFIEKGGLERSRRARAARGEEEARRDRTRRIEDELRPATSTQEHGYRQAVDTSVVGEVLGAIARFLSG